MSSEYLTDVEYERYWFELGGMRRAISESLELVAGVTVLDVGTGWGLFAIEMAKQLRRGEIVGIDIVSDGIRMAKKLVGDAEVADVVEILRMDATKLSFADDRFDVAVSFLGMRDVYMTSGREGVKSATEEMVRVAKRGGRIVVCVTPPEDVETEDQRVAVEVEGRVFGAESLPKKFYVDVFRDNDVVLMDARAYYTGKRLTASQAMIELKEGIEIARKIYGGKVPDFEDVWDRYGGKIEEFGYGMYSKVVVLMGEKAA